ncbi:MAG: aminotransferase class V-fold PLP-dependent enzyme [Clostridiales bacterium]|jgi:L-cysteine/cystine lyase|nr:aminotransferase class V-fold PLP-dependent enzyme [Clostridiales bacterium]
MKEIDEKIRYIREQLNIAPDVVAINNASWGPLSRAAASAAAEQYYGDYFGRRYAADSFIATMLEILKEDRRELALFLNCSPDEIALTESTTTGMNICLWGFDFKEGDEIISTTLENGACFAALNTLAARRGVKVRYADLGRVGENDAAKAIERLITPKTRMALLSHVFYMSGVTANAREISELCRRRGVFSVFDGVQAAGTQKIDVKAIGCDAYCLARHKFLAGPDGAGALYIREGSLEAVEPTFSGVFTDINHGMEGYHPMGTAARFDVSTRPFPVQAAAAANMRWLRTEVGYDFVNSRSGPLRGKLFDMMETIDNLELYSIRTYSDNAALILFRLKNMEVEELARLLRDHKIYNRPVEHIYPADHGEPLSGVRISIAYWNKDEDLEIIAKTLRQAAKL